MLLTVVRGPASASGPLCPGLPFSCPVCLKLPLGTVGAAHWGSRQEAPACASPRRPAQPRPTAACVQCPVGSVHRQCEPRPRWPSCVGGTRRPGQAGEAQWHEPALPIRLPVRSRGPGPHLRRGGSWAPRAGQTSAGAQGRTGQCRVDTLWNSWVGPGRQLGPEEGPARGLEWGRAHQEGWGRGPGDPAAAAREALRCVPTYPAPPGRCPSWWPLQG